MVSSPKKHAQPVANVEKVGGSVIHQPHNPSYRTQVIIVRPRKSGECEHISPPPSGLKNDFFHFVLEKRKMFFQYKSIQHLTAKQK